MKKFEMKLANAKMLTREEMRQVLGAERNTCVIECCDDYGWYVGSQGTGGCDQSDGDTICDILFRGNICGCQCNYI